MNDLMDKLLIELFMAQVLPFIQRGIVDHDDPF